MHDYLFRICLNISIFKYIESLKKIYRIFFLFDKATSVERFIQTMQDVGVEIVIGLMNRLILMLIIFHVIWR